MFWDEPQTKLNPRALKQVAKTIVELSRSGVQAFMATHSLFLLREIDILLADTSNKEVGEQTRFIGLHRTEEGVAFEQGPTISDIGDITALDEEVNQSDRYLREAE